MTPPNEASVTLDALERIEAHHARWINQPHTSNGQREDSRTILSLCAEIRHLRGALEWYADKENYQSRAVSLGCGCCSDIKEPAVDDDNGERARNALEGTK